MTTYLHRPPRDNYPSKRQASHISTITIQRASLRVHTQGSGAVSIVLQNSPYHSGETIRYV